MAERALMPFEEELTIRELKHLIDRIQQLSLYVNNLDQLPNSSVDERSAARDFKEYLAHKYQIVMRVLKIRFRERGTSRQHDELGFLFNGFPSESDDELRAEIERRRAQIQIEKRLYEEVARAFKIGPDHQLWPSYQLPTNSKELSTSPKAIEAAYPKPALPDEAIMPGSAQGADLKEGRKQGEPTETPRHDKPLPLDPAAHWELSRRPLAATTRGTSPKQRGGRPKNRATVAFKELLATQNKLSIPRMCETFDKQKVPVPKMLSSAKGSDDVLLSWHEVLHKNRGKLGAWLREKRRKPRARGKLKKG